MSTKIVPIDSTTSNVVDFAPRRAAADKRRVERAAAYIGLSGAWFSWLRKERGLTRAQLADLADVPISHIALAERSGPWHFRELEEWESVAAVLELEELHEMLPDRGPFDVLMFARGIRRAANRNGVRPRGRRAQEAPCSP